ncbi:hypothetical protein EDB89DRAFT_2239122 [Lactarius sanguifluus]|nr:hypothetical protein EDB89DRAFT_2239122 [Lactarius sanguifluus]
MTDHNRPLEGKFLEGLLSSAINSMVWKRGSRADYDIWGTTLGNGEEWTFEELLPRCRAGIAPNANLGDDNDLSMPAQGVARTVDPCTGLRSYSTSAYLTPKLALVIIYAWSRTTRKAEAVGFQSAGKTYIVAVSKEVIMTAGSLESPQILELWGVGNRTPLERLGTPPEIRENLQDHPVTLSDFKLKPDIMALDSFANATFTSEQQVLLLVMSSMTTPFGFNAMRASLDHDLVARTLTALQKAQYHLKDLVDSGEEGWVEIAVVPSGRMRGPPKAGENYNFDVLYYGTKFLKWIQTKPLADLIGEWITPPASLLDAEWEKFVKTAVRKRESPNGSDGLHYFGTQRSKDLSSVVTLKHTMPKKSSASTTSASGASSGPKTNYALTKPYGGTQGFMHSYGLNMWSDNDVQEAKAILDGFREIDAAAADGDKANSK